MADIINIHTRERTKVPEPSHRDSEYILADDDWDTLCDMMEWAGRSDIELFIIEAMERE